MKPYLLSAIILFLLSACNVTGVEPKRPTTASLSAPTPDPTLVASGETVYAQYCAECHGENLEGEVDWKAHNVDGSFRAPPHDDSGHTWHHSDRVLREAVLHGDQRLSILGTSNMPGYTGVLTDDEVEAVLTYNKSTWPEDVRAIQWEQTANDPGAVDEN